MVHPNALDNQLENLRTLQQSYDAVAGAAEAYNVGKTQLAAAITAKGVPTLPTESYPEMAEKITDIQQRTIDITAPNWYGGQIGADGALWDLYAVLADMKNRFMGADQYACLIVCEYYRGYDSLQLQGADAYYTCDGDYYDTSSPLHVWHDSDNGKMNRWVCFLFATEGARLDITNTAISPRSMYIGGHIGTIEYFVNGRLTELVCGVEETDVVDNFLSSIYTQAWNRNCIIRGVKFLGDYFICDSDGVVDIQTDTITENAGGAIRVPNAYIVKINNLKTVNGNNVGIQCDKAIGDICDDLEDYGAHAYDNFVAGGSNYLQFLSFAGLKKLPNNAHSSLFYGNLFNLIDIKVGNMETNIHFEKWNPTTVLADADKKAQLINNIKNNILARVSDATGGTQLVFTVSTNMYNAIASETITWNDEEMTLADAFLTKNWLLAGA